MKLFCRHKWELISSETTESRFEHAVKILGGAQNLPWQMSCVKRNKIDILSCDSCGKLKRFVTVL